MNSKICKALRTIAREATVGCPERAYVRKAVAFDRKGRPVAFAIKLDSDERKGGVKNTREVYKRLKKAVMKNARMPSSGF